MHYWFALELIKRLVDNHQISNQCVNLLCTSITCTLLLKVWGANINSTDKLAVSVLSISPIGQVQFSKFNDIFLIYKIDCKSIISTSWKQWISDSLWLRKIPSRFIKSATTQEYWPILCSRVRFEDPQKLQFVSSPLNSKKPMYSSRLAKWQSYLQS